MLRQAEIRVIYEEGVEAVTQMIRRGIVNLNTL